MTCRGSNGVGGEGGTRRAEISGAGNGRSGGGAGDGKVADGDGDGKVAGSQQRKVRSSRCVASPNDGMSTNTNN